MLCKNENRDPEHCLAEGRKVTRCAQAVITKLRENCLQEFDNHWKCLENNNQVSCGCEVLAGALPWSQDLVGWRHLDPEAVLLKRLFRFILETS